jgi:hypothetical protein
MKLTDETSCTSISAVRLSFTLATLILAASNVIIFAHPPNTDQVNGTASTITEDRLVGLWRGKWEDLLVPRVKSEVDSSPLWLRLQMEGDKLTGLAIHDYVGLADTSEMGVKKLKLTKREEVALFDFKLNRNVLSFKEHFGGKDTEYRLELIGESGAQLNIKQDGQFRKWLTLTREKQR